jgi:hypothetical protein
MGKSDEAFFEREEYEKNRIEKLGKEKWDKIV